MKICLVSQEYPPETGAGGIGTQTFLKAHGLSGRGHEVHVLSIDWDGPGRTYRDQGAVIHRVPAPDLGGLSYDGPPFWLAYSIAVAQNLQKLAQEVPFDIIHFPEYAGEGFIFQTETFAHRTARYVVQLHGPLALFARYHNWPEPGSVPHQVGCLLERTVIHHSDLVMASSRNTATFCAEEFGYPLSQIQIVHSAVDTERWRVQPATGGPGPKLLFVGKRSASKGYVLLVRAILRLRERYPSICCRAIGPGEPEVIDGVTALIATARADANFDIRGYVPREELPEHYGWCDVFAGPSLHEPGPGNIYLEAMACARPVIACNSGGAPEVVIDGETGLLMPPHQSEGMSTRSEDVAALANAIAQLAEDAGLRQRLGRRGREWVEERFSLTRYTDRVERLYKDLLS